MVDDVTDVVMDGAINRKLISKYDSMAEAEALAWISQMTGQMIPQGRENVQRSLKNGQILVKLVDAVYERTPNLPERAKIIRRPLKANSLSSPFKHMENILIFLDAAEAYGVPRESLFQTVDLFESRNMSQVINTILQLGTECQRNAFQGPICGPRPVQSRPRQWTEEQLRSSEGIIGLQAGTNKLASQKGMSFGAQRHCADSKGVDASPSGMGVVSLQMGTNKYASQKGMSFGSVRHVSDIRCDDMSKEGQSVLTLQMGTNQCASQKGMRMGGTRHGADIRCDDMSKDGQSIINLQYGTNKLASQSGMRMGGQRHISDIQCEQISALGSSTLGLQMGPTKDQVASQSGMSFGSHRHINDSY